jgi:leucyl-tRNA synthetase
LFGPDFERYEQVQAELAQAEAEREGQKAPEDKVKAKKGKLDAKSTGLTYQFQIMESIGVPRSEIKKFGDPSYWLTYFIPITIVGSSQYIRCYLHSNHSKERPKCLWFTY